MISFTFPNESILGKKRHPVPFDYDDISIISGQVINLTKEKVRKSVGVLVRFESGPFRQRMDPVGVAQEGISGYIRSDGDEYFFSREEASLVTVVLDTTLGASTGILRVTYYG